MITQMGLKELLDYNAETGVFTWLSDSGSNKIKGIVAGSVWKGYISISINNVGYKAHRLAWLYVYGEWPNIVDHVDGNPSNNKIDNLRNVTQRKNQQNRTKHRQGTLVGTSYDKQRKKWRSTITINGKSKHLGRFKTEQLAHDAYLNKLKEIEK